MGATLVLDRISAWERAGAIDHELAERLRAMEAAAPAAVEAPQPPALQPAARPTPMPTARLRSSGFILEFFAYLGGLFILLAWYAWFVIDMPEWDPERQLSIGIATLVPAVVLGIGGWILASLADDRVRRASAVALVVATANAGMSTWFLLQAAGVERSGDLLAFLAGTVVALAVALAARVRRPSAITQAGLLAAWGAFGIGASAWTRDAVWPRIVGGGAAGDQSEQVILNLAQLAWWWLVAAVPAAMLVWRPDRTAGHEARDTVTRIGIGTIAVLGTTSVMLAISADERVFAAWLAAAILFLVGAVFVAAARWSGSRVHLVSAGAAIVIGLTYLNAEYVAGPAGVAVALLVEGIILLSVAVLGWAAGRLITQRRAARSG